MELKINSRWMFVGEGLTGLRHTIIDLDTDEVVTWSDPVPGNPTQGPAGFSWLGSRTEFLKNFKPTAK